MAMNATRRIISEVYLIVVNCAWSLSLIGLVYTFVRSVFYGDSGFLFFGLLMLSIILYVMRQR